MSRFFLVFIGLLTMLATTLGYANALYNQRAPCGLVGTIEQRINDCSRQSTSEKPGWLLVTRTNEFKEVWQDRRTGFFWGDILSYKLNNYQARSACKGTLAEVGRLSNLKWYLPSMEDYQSADQNGIRSVLPNMNYWFLSSSIYHGNYSDLVFSFNGLTGQVQGIDREEDDPYAIRCIAYKIGIN